MNLLSKKPAPPTLDEREASAHAQASAALSVFATVAADLEDAAATLRGVAQVASDEADRLAAKAADAEDSAEENLAAARRIRDLVAGTPA